MSNSRNDLLHNLIDENVIDADLSAISIDDELATKIGEALCKYPSIQSVDFTSSDLDDTGFEIIKNFLVQRNKPLVELKLDLTEVTSGSMNTLMELIEKKLIKRLMLFKIKGIHNNPENIKKLSDCANDNSDNANNHKIYINFEHPNRRLATETLFEKSIDEQKDSSKIEREFKQQHDINPLQKSR